MAGLTLFLKGSAPHYTASVAVDAIVAVVALAVHLVLASEDVPQQARLQLVAKISVSGSSGIM